MNIELPLAFCYTSHIIVVVSRVKRITIIVRVVISDVEWTEIIFVKIKGMGSTIHLIPIKRIGAEKLH